MKISVFGLGYVGTVCAACLAKHGHHVVGVDKSAAKMEAVEWRIARRRTWPR